MEHAELQLDNDEPGYLSILRAFRVPVAVASRAAYPRLEAQVHGTLPAGVEPPLFAASSVSSFSALNSGGRGVIFSHNEKHYRLKGADIDGALSRAVAHAPNNHIPDITQRLSDFESARFDDAARLRYGWNYQLPSHHGKPFSLLLPEAVERERAASEQIAQGFERNGFLPAYQCIARIDYPTILWNLAPGILERGQPCSSALFELPSLESDLRFEEFSRFAFLHLKCASRDELLALKEPMRAFSERIATWHGYNARIMKDAGLAPTPSSHQYQNYALSHVAANTLGLSRVDHTSTVMDRPRAHEYADGIVQQPAFFGQHHLNILFGLHLQTYDPGRYTGLFHRAWNWQGAIDAAAIPEFMPALRQQGRAFVQGYHRMDPAPIPLAEFRSLMTQIYAIRRNVEHEQRIDALRMKIIPRHSRL